ncbi:hypothetical protein L1049_004166 [Liquidambar formosana]|uniref:Stress-related protein n=1 Tax=Liquidambar formosana TaxID=63359 RepID=A0AAP0RSU3_LIQFO
MHSTTSTAVPLNKPHSCPCPCTLHSLSSQCSSTPRQVPRKVPPDRGVKLIQRSKLSLDVASVDALTPSAIVHTTRGNKIRTIAKRFCFRFFLESRKASETFRKWPNQNPNSKQRLRFETMRRGSNIWISSKWRRSTSSSASQPSTNTPRKTPAVEGTVKTVIGPVYEKFHDVPIELLKFVDRKVEESINELDRHVPSLLKRASSQAFTAAQKAPELARAVASEVQRTGVVDTAKNITKTVYVKYEPTAKELYWQYEPVAEHYAVSAWRSLNRLPLFPQVAEIVVPTAAYWTEKYNQAVCCMAEKGYTVSTYLPLIPTERIVKVFEGAEPGPTVSTDGEAAAVAH